MELSLDGIKAVIFDLDGTLYLKPLLPLRLIFSDPRHMFVLGNERKARAELKGRRFGTAEAYYTALFMRVAEMSRCTPEYARHWYEEDYMPLMQRLMQRHYHLEPWVAEVLAELRRRGIKTAVYSDYGCVRERLEALRFDCNWVDMIADAPSLGGLKPCKESAMKICEELGVKPEETVIVGDRDDTDGESARLCGMRFILYTKKDSLSLKS